MRNASVAQRLKRFNSPPYMGGEDMKPTRKPTSISKERFINYTIAISEGWDLTEYSDVVEWLESVLK